MRLLLYFRKWKKWNDEKISTKKKKKNTPSSIQAEGKMKLDIETEEDIGRNGYISDVIFH